MEELYKVMDDFLEVEFQMKAGMDILKELEEFYMLEKGKRLIFRYDRKIPDYFSVAGAP